MGLPEILIDNDFFKINLTVVLSILAFCLTAMGTLVKIYGVKKEIPTDEKPGKTTTCTENKQNGKDNSAAILELKKEIQSLKTQMATTIIKIENSGKTLDELKSDYRSLADKLDNLLKQLLDLLS